MAKLLRIESVSRDDKKVLEELAREIIFIATNKLGERTTPQLLQEIVRRVLDRLDIGEASKEEILLRKRAVLILYGEERPGTVSKFSQLVSECDGIIEDLGQKILRDYSVFLAIIDISRMNLEFSQFKEKLEKLAKELGIGAIVKIRESFGERQTKGYFSHL